MTVTGVVSFFKAVGHPMAASKDAPPSDLPGLDHMFGF